MKHRRVFPPGSFHFIFWCRSTLSPPAIETRCVPLPYPLHPSFSTNYILQDIRWRILPSSKKILAKSHANSFCKKINRAYKFAATTQSNDKKVQSDALANDISRILMKLFLSVLFQPLLPTLLNVNFYTKPPFAPATRVGASHLFSLPEPWGRCSRRWWPW